MTGPDPLTPEGRAELRRLTLIGMGLYVAYGESPTKLSPAETEIMWAYMARCTAALPAALDALDRVEALAAAGLLIGPHELFDAIRGEGS